MGLFDLFGGSLERKVATALDEIRAMGLGVKGLDAEIEGEVVTLTGVAPDLDVKTRVVVEFNKRVKTRNTLNKIRLEESPASVAAEEAVREAIEEKPAERIYEVQSGDTLGKISQQFYGKASKYMKIFEANRDILDNPDLIKVGQKLKIPG
jgi:LysM repeat protein